MLTLTQAVSRVAARLNKNPNDATVYARLKNHINDTCMEKWNNYAWSFRYRDYPLVLSPVVTSGTVTATNGSQTVTASGTPFSTTLHPGAWIEFTDDSVSALYRVQNVNSTSSITIEPAYQGTTASGKAYRLTPTDYLVPSEITDLAHFSVTSNGRPLDLAFPTSSMFYSTPHIALGTPTSAQVYNQSQTLTTYTTGTVSGSSGSASLTGAGTAWLTNVQPGDEILIDGDTNTYRVYAIHSDTSITLYNKLTTAASTDTYTISRQFGKVLRINSGVDTAYVVFMKGLRSYAPLINTADTNELLARFPSAVIEGAVWREAGSSPDPREDSLFMRSELMWAKAQGEDEQIFPHDNHCPIWDARWGR